jgi:cysteine synthase A
MSGTDCVPGNTPIVEVDGIFAKLECVNPCGSIKDRMVDYVLRKSEESGLLKKGMTIVEATSGNTGISLAYFGREMGYKVVIIMPKNMTDERKNLIRSLDAELILCSDGNFAEAAAIRDELVVSRGYFTTDQFANPLNVECHYETTGQEILQQLFGKTIDAFVAGVGTGGTLIGVGNALKDLYPACGIIAVEPAESAVMSWCEPGFHNIPGIGDGFIPCIVKDSDGNLHPLIDEVVKVSSAEAKSAAIELGRSGYCVGISSGANFLASKQMKRGGANVVTIFPDGFFKYRSQGLEKNDSCIHQESCACKVGPEHP